MVANSRLKIYTTCIMFLFHFSFFLFSFFWESIYQCALHIKISQPNNRIRASRLSVDEVATMKSQVQPITIPINLDQLIKVHIIGGNPTKLNKLIYQGCMKHAIEPICTTRTHNFCVIFFFFFLVKWGGWGGIIINMPLIVIPLDL